MRSLLCQATLGLLLAAPAMADIGFDRGSGRFAMWDTAAGGGDCAAVLDRQEEMIRAILLSTFEVGYAEDGPTGLRWADAPRIPRPRPRLATLTEEEILPAPVPLPGAGALLLGGLAAGIAMRTIRHRRARQREPQQADATLAVATRLP